MTVLKDHMKTKLKKARNRARVLFNNSRSNAVMIMTKEKYYQKIDDLAYDIWEVALDRSNYDTQMAEFMLDSVIREKVDEHAWVNNALYHADILKHSEESEEYLNFLSPDAIYNLLSSEIEGIDGLTSCAVFFAMVADIKDTFNYTEEWSHLN